MTKFNDKIQKLSREAYYVTQQCGTEAPFSGIYNSFYEEGDYHCAVCESKLFNSETKFNSGSGWPSFYEAGGTIKYLEDISHGMKRVEIRCGNCDAHLGHVFDDGPKPTGKRYCVNSLSLLFIPSSK